ncbi:MAG: hypothetical protein AB1611_07610 [bacterium]
MRQSPFITGYSSRMAPGSVPVIVVALLISLLLDCRMSLAVRSSCLDCHLGSARPELARYAQQWLKSAHALVPVCCEECHGGNPASPKTPVIGKEGFIGSPGKRDIPALCDRCHADALYMRKHDIRVDEENLYKNSIHGRELLERDNQDAASCVDCHGSHDIRKPDDPQSTVSHQNIADTCARCHANRDLMEPYGLPTDQLTRYKKSYHGQIVYQQVEGGNPRLAPSCPGCHGIHGGKPAGVDRVSDACNNCHLNCKRYFQKSIHSLMLKKNGKPRCIDCHGYHDIPPPSEELFTGKAASHCGTCHSPESPEYRNGQRLRALIKRARREAARSQSKIIRVKQDLDIDVSSLNLRMEDVLENLGQAIKATHSQDIQVVSQIISNARKYIIIIDQQVDQCYQEARQRKQWLGRMLLLISVAFLLVAYQRHRLKNQGSKIV